MWFGEKDYCGFWSISLRFISARPGVPSYGSGLVKVAEQRPYIELHRHQTSTVRTACISIFSGELEIRPKVKVVWELVNLENDNQSWINRECRSAWSFHWLKATFATIDNGNGCPWHERSIFMLLTFLYVLWFIRRTNKSRIMLHVSPWSCKSKCILHTRRWANKRTLYFLCYTVFWLPKWNHARTQQKKQARGTRSSVLTTPCFETNTHNRSRDLLEMKLLHNIQFLLLTLAPIYVTLAT